jgi:hypothetical protein
MEAQPKNYEAMTLEELEADPVASPVVQGAALEYLIRVDKDFIREFKKDVDSEGNLVSISDVEKAIGLKPFDYVKWHCRTKEDAFEMIRAMVGAHFRR